MLTSVAFPTEKPFWNRFSKKETSRSALKPTVKQGLLSSSLHYKVACITSWHSVLPRFGQFVWMISYRVSFESIFTLHWNHYCVNLIPVPHIITWNTSSIHKLWLMVKKNILNWNDFMFWNQKLRQTKL